MKTFDVGGGHLAYWDSGSGTPLVLIHGVGTTGSLWAADLEPLASSFRVIAYDRRGYGGSSESPRDWRAHRDDASKLVDALGARPAVLVGYSAGASIALDLVLERPDIAASLVLLDPAVNLRRCITPSFIRAQLGARLLRRLRSERHGAEHWIRYVASYSTGGTAFDKASPERRETLLANAAGIFADAGSGLSDLDEARIAAIDVPITLVEAELSPSFLRRSCARLRGLLPKARVVRMKTSHHITIDARDELLQILRESAPTGARLDVAS